MWAIGKRKPEKIGASTGFEPVTSANTDEMLYNLSYEATHWERGQFVEFMSPVRNEMTLSIYEIIHIWAADVDESEEWSSQLIFQFEKLERRRASHRYSRKSRIRIPLKLWFFSGFFFPIAQIGKLTAMIILHFHLLPQFKYELFHIYFTSFSKNVPKARRTFTNIFRTFPNVFRRFSKKTEENPKMFWSDTDKFKCS